MENAHRSRVTYAVTLVNAGLRKQGVRASHNGSRTDLASVKLVADSVQETLNLLDTQVSLGLSCIEQLRTPECGARSPLPRVISEVFIGNESAGANVYRSGRFDSGCDWHLS